MSTRWRTALLAGIILCTATISSAFAQNASPPMALTAPAPASPRPAVVRVALVTSEGRIVLELEKQRAPITAGNFLHYVDQKRLDGAVFYRALNLAPDVGLVQGGLRNDPRKLFKPIAHEPTTVTGLTHDNGAISMARGAPGTANADFFIVLGEMKSLDASPASSGDNGGFAVFGHVVEGMDVVKKILTLPTSATDGDGAMKGQILLAPIAIKTARRIP
jgi:peptidyl-prolyl cis-trans isomerase A (cyclophilin A)